MQQFFQEILDKIFRVIFSFPHFQCFLCIWTTLVWIRLRVFISFNSVFCMGTSLVSVSFANFHFCRQSSLCMLTTLVWISLENFHFFWQHWFRGRGGSLKLYFSELLCLWLSSGSGLIFVSILSLSKRYAVMGKCWIFFKNYVEIS